ncbi:MAG: hypothetical protein C5B46_01895 [Proteobacteria bacterium]|nr:MAG: hypothetical protein C5B46_01895 [Pseudomonadota bacterium]
MFVCVGTASAFLLSGRFAHAESVQWNAATFAGYTAGNYIDACDTPLLQRLQFGYPCISILNSPNVSVTYNVRATNETTGENVCNTTVPAGTKIKFEFVPHVYSDVSWFGTGYDFDSPYGDWSANADHPPTSDAAQWCADKNFFKMGGYRKQYILLQVAPPVQTVANTQGLTCSSPSADGSVECAAASGGSVTPQFQFQSTIGKFYYALDFAPSTPGNCVAAPDPLYIHTSDIYTNVGGRQPLIVDVPSQSISCPITVTPPPNTSPAKPTVSGSCTIGQPSEMDFSTTDPENDQIRYGIDWDMDGTVDQWVPPTGYIASGSHQSASRTYSSTGSKSIQVLAEDSSGARSPWSQYTFSCAQAQQPPQQCPAGQTLVNGVCTQTSCPSGQMLVGDSCVQIQCPAGQHLDASGQCVGDQQQCPAGQQLVNGSCTQQCAEGQVLVDGACVVGQQCPTGQHFNGTSCVADNCSIGYQYQNGSCVFVSCPVGYTQQGTQCVWNGCPVGYTQQGDGTCIWSGCPSGYVQEGSQCIEAGQCTSLPYCQGRNLLNGCTHELIQSCQWGCSQGACKTTPSPSVSLSASPSIVNKGHSTNLSWTSQHASACTVSGSNGDHWTGPSNNHQQSSDLTSATVFTVHCDGLAGASPASVEKSITVNVNVTWVEN